LPRSLKQEHPAFAMPDLFSASSQLREPSKTSCLCRHTFCLWKNRTGCEPREQKSALLTRMVLSVEAGIEIDFRMNDSLLPWNATFKQRSSMPCRISWSSGI
jgi:hypothetical protein